MTTPEIQPLRRASRQVVRELGVISERLFFGVTAMQCHILVELDTRGSLTSGQLTSILTVDKSTVSRAVKQLADRGLIRVRPDSTDRRKKSIDLTARGRERTKKIHGLADSQVSEALSLLAPKERIAVVRGMQLYARALELRRRSRDLEIRGIHRRDDSAVARIIRHVMPEFGAVGSGYAIEDAEVDAMSETYRQPGSAYWVVVKDGRVIGGAGYGPLAGGESNVCELRKMYLLSEARGLGLGAQLLSRCLDGARADGYQKIYLETLEHMHQAKRLYERFGFEKRGRPLGETGHFGCDAWYERAL